MKKIAVVTCSTSGIDYLDFNKDLTILRMTVSFDGKEYIDFKEIKADEFYQMMLTNPNAEIHTSQISTGKFVECYEKLKNEGYQSILVITVSSKLSGTYQSATLAKEMVEGVDIEILDSKSVSYGEAFLAKEALSLIDQGSSLSEVIERLNSLTAKCKIYVLVDTLKYLVKNGRLSSTAGLLGTLLKIKPLLKIFDDGTLKPFEKIRTTTKAQKRALEILMQETADKEVEYCIAYTTNYEQAIVINNEIKKIKPNANIIMLPLTPVVGAHAGPGTIGLGYSEK